MEIALLSCPLCLKPHFNGVEALRSSLINVATTQLPCPVCNELLLGLDKLTIHLFSHVTTHINTAIAANAIAATTTTAPKIEPMIVNITIENQPSVDLAPPNNQTENVRMVEREIISEAKQMFQSTTQPSSSPLMQCDICSFSFTDETILEMHKRLLHKQTPAIEQTGTQKYHCHLCTKKFKMRGSLMVHLRVAHYGFHGTDKNDVNEISQQLDKMQNAQVQVEATENCNSPGSNAEKLGAKVENKQWECDVCQKLFTTKYFLKKHKRLHTGEMPYFCAQCNKAFTFQQSYHKHMLYHTAEKPHVCNACGRAFKELSTLHNHERIHSGERPFACETCGKCFRQRVSYLVHRRIHTGAMPYKCTACDKSFRYKVSQRSHKCSAQPPGSVIRAPDFLQKLLFIHNSPQPNATSNESNNMNNQSPLLEISAETINGVFTTPDVGQQQSNLDSPNTNDNSNISNLLNETVAPDFFSMVLSTQMPDVQTLCLSPDDHKDMHLIHRSPPTAAQNSNLHQSSANSVLETINEESLKHLLYGHTN